MFNKNQIHLIWVLILQILFVQQYEQHGDPKNSRLKHVVRDTSDIRTYTGPKLYNSGKYYNRTLNEHTSPVGYRSKKTTLLTEHIIHEGYFEVILPPICII